MKRNTQRKRARKNQYRAGGFWRVRSVVAVFVAAVLAFAGYHALAAEKPQGELRSQAQKAQQAGNFKDAYEVWAKLVVDPKDDPMLVSQDLGNAIQCLQNLGRVSEVDELREKVIGVHKDNWRLLHSAAQSYQDIQHEGFIISGKFERGGHRGGGRLVNAFERDRVRALQLMQQAAQKALEEKNKGEVAEFYFRFADMLLDQRGGSGSWRLQYLSDLGTLPDYEEGYPRWYYGGGNDRGAPVDEKGNPVYHNTPKSWEIAKTDGERWRWCLMQAAEYSPAVAFRAKLVFANFLHQEFGVQTMAQFGFPFGRRMGTPGGIGVGPAAEDDDTRKDESGPYAVSNLKETETIARLANGIKRFTMPDEFNPIKLFQDLGDAAPQTEGEQALNNLGQIFEDRQQYDRAAEFWKKNIAKFGPGPQNYKQQRVNQILGNWGEFDAAQTVPAGKEPTLAFVFRNGKKVDFTAHQIDVKKLLDDVKAYIKTKPAQMDGQRIGVDVHTIGYRLVEQNQRQYLVKESAKWGMDLKPRDKHFDRRIFVKTPLKDAGAYLIEAKMDGGNTTRVIAWIADTAMVKKAMDKGSYYFVADAVTGSPIAKATVDFFGWNQRWLGDGRKFEIKTKEFAEFTDADGSLKLPNEQANNEYQWLITASTPEGRMAYLGYTGLWAGDYHDADYNMNKVLTITDRPVYRPAQTVKFKTWIGTAKYDQEGPSPFADKTYTVRVTDPRGEKVVEKAFTTDAYGGFDGEVPLSKEATLGVWSIQILNPGPIHMMGGNSFRVEEYKKPEFEVKVDAPTEPVMLGEKITATIKCNYYFGAPVTSAKVKYKVTRTAFSANWYPMGKWDWFYQPGYWWFAPDYLWYPGFMEWGCRRPWPFWYPQRPERPEIVMENEVPVGADGTVKVEIDTAVAKAVHADKDHKYQITAEVTDASRRTIVGEGTVSVARKPFTVYAWVDRGYYRSGDAVRADFTAQTLDNKPIKGKGELKLLSVAYQPDPKTGHLKPVEKEVQAWPLETNEEGRSHQMLKADKPGQYRLSYKVTDAKNHTIEGGYLFVVRGDTFDGKEFRFNDLEMITDKKEYAPGDTLKLMINTNRDGGTVLVFVRPTNGIYLPPKVVRLKGKSTVEEIAVIKKDMPNFFVECLTISNGKAFNDTREIVVPPENRVLNVEVLPSQQKYKPGEKAKVTLKLTDGQGKPVVGSAVVSIYDKSVEYISGGSATPEIKSFFWKWRRHHYPRSEVTLGRMAPPIYRNNEITLQPLGSFGHMVADLPMEGEELATLGDELNEVADSGGALFGGAGGGRGGGRMAMRQMATASPAAPGAALSANGEAGYAADALSSNRAEKSKRSNDAEDKKGDGGGDPGGEVAASLRSKFADTALWAAALTTNTQGMAEVELTMPENLTTWKTKVWTMSAGTRVGEGSAEVVTYKNLIVRLQAPRFFVQKDEVVLSANVHNYLKAAKNVRVVLSMPGEYLAPIDGPQSLSKIVTVPPDGEARVDWRVKVVHPGEATVRMDAITDEESDAMQLSFPVFIHGMLKTDSFSGAMRPADKAASLTFNVPKERIVADSRVELRYSPSVASAMVDALPYMVDYPYGCTEQTLNRFLPTVITQRVLLDMKLDLKDIQTKRTNLNAQEIGDDQKRGEDWKRNNPPNPGQVRNPVFDIEEVKRMTKDGVNRLTNMQNADGGWGWFSGFGEQSYPHTTAVVVHGLMIARDNDVALVPGVLERGIEWLKRYQADQVTLIKRAPAKVIPYKEKADNLDAFVYMVLIDAGIKDAPAAGAAGDPAAGGPAAAAPAAPGGARRRPAPPRNPANPDGAGGPQMDDMREFLYRDRVDLAVYCKAMFGLALQKQGGQKEKLDMILQNISQFLVKDGENQTAYLRLPEGVYRYYWYGTDTEANAYYLKLLSRTDPKGETASLLSKYLINNRKHATYWNSTRDTAVCIEALADFIRGSGEDKPDMTVAISLDGKKVKEVKIDSTNFFSFDNKLVVTGEKVTDGPHKIEFTKTGTGPLYFNAYVTNFTLEDPIKKAGLEIKVERKFYKLVPVDAKIKVSGQRGQSLDQKVEKYERQPLSDLATLKSGELVEIELEIESKNDYEYIIFEDMKASGFEPIEVRSGYNGNDLGAYMELRDERVAFFVRALARGKHSVSYRMRAEIPGKFSALPTKASAMYAPELRANSDEFKVNIVDAPELAPKPKAAAPVPAAAPAQKAVPAR